MQRVVGSLSQDFHGTELNPLNNERGDGNAATLLPFSSPTIRRPCRLAEGAFPVTTGGFLFHNAPAFHVEPLFFGFSHREGFAG